MFGLITRFNGVTVLALFLLTTVKKLNIMKEIWKDIPCYEGHYQVSHLGNVKSLKYNKPRLLKCNSINGYLDVILCINGNTKHYQVHQLVAIAFLDHKIDGYKKVINHINFNRSDNRVENLKIVTHRENANRKHLNSSSKYTGVSWYKKTKRWQCHIRIDGVLVNLGYYHNELEAHKAYQNRLNQL